MSLAKKLRKKGLNVEIDLLSRSLSKQFEYADSKGIPKVILIGEKDLKKGFVTEKDMRTGKQKKVRI